jgi:hypothetical protein
MKKSKELFHPFMKFIRYLIRDALKSKLIFKDEISHTFRFNSQIHIIHMLRFVIRTDLTGGVSFQCGCGEGEGDCNYRRLTPKLVFT